MLTKQPTDLHATGIPTILEDKYFCRLLVLGMILAVVVLGFSLDTSPIASASARIAQMPLTGYCNNPNPHCYATRDWYGHTGGSFTRIQPFGKLDCQGCIGFVDDEMWFADPYSSQCTSVGACWVEAGISTYALNNPNSCNHALASTCLFWADNRPGTGGYHEHPMFYFGSIGVNLSAYLVDETLYNSSSYSSSGSSWSISVAIYQNGNLIATPSGQSTSNSMNVDDIRIGSELSDSKGYADIFELEHNQFRDTGTGIYKYQTTTGTNTSTNPPPTGYWATSPCNCQGNTGGAYATYDH